MYHKHLYFYYHCLSQLVKIILQDDNTVALSYGKYCPMICCYDDTVAMTTHVHCHVRRVSFIVVDIVLYAWTLMMKVTNHYMCLYMPAVYRIVVPNVSELSTTQHLNDYLDGYAYKHNYMTT